ncbi:glycoside hydrolase family 3 N-terminal domain-containing protein [Halomicrococcus sp. NG-SE-24]|uniref:glycoside hydrolase family 3 N-terminal domain-containing protein n=1 Tax=Halomicrococcus sp. NG-SE-24 TaxID=3436928 RepID=UPI003D99B4DC
MGLHRPDMSGDRSQDPTVDRLVARMTLDEKVAQLGTVRVGALLEDGTFSEEKAAAEIADGIGRVTRFGRESDLGPCDLARVANEVQAFLDEETRLGVPAIVREESLCGYAGKGGSTFPQSIGLASTWNPATIERVANEVSRQLEAVGVGLTLSPVADVARDFRWGRTEETYGEDPFLVAEMATACVAGLQGPDRDGVFATLKHFAGHGAPRGGRNRASVDVSPRVFRERHLFPFEAALDAGDAASVMAAYHDVDGIPCHASRELLTDLLRDDWGFEGTVVSDGRGIEMLATDHRVAPNRQAAGVLAMNAGIDVEVPETECYGDELVAAVEDGRVDERRIDEAVRRHLREKVQLGLFDDPFVDPTAARNTFETDAQRALAREAARQSIVLLQNRGELLPLDTDVDSLAVVGPNADAPRNLLGNYAYGANDDKDSSVRVVSPLAGIKAAAPDGTAVTHVEGCSLTDGADADVATAADAAREADVAVVCVGGKSGIDVEHDSTGTSGEALDRAELGLPGRQRELLQAVHASGTPVVAVLVGGRPLAVEWTAANVPAVVEAWLPGEEGGNAIADVLFGDANPGGKLPVSIPRSVGQSSVAYDRKPVASDHEYVFADAGPLYPFGHGESYTTFEYGDLDIDPATVTPSGAVTASVDVANAGRRAGDEVVQFYARTSVASRVRPSRSLVGFRRVSLEPGEIATVECHLPSDLVAFYDREERLVVEPGDVEVLVGSSSADVRASETFEIRGDTTPVTERRYFSDVTIDERE